MKLTIESTERFFMAGEVMVRMWRGTTADGEEVVALVAGVILPNGPFEVPDLVEIPAPDAEEARKWAERILGPGQ